MYILYYVILYYIVLLCNIYIYISARCCCALFVTSDPHGRNMGPGSCPEAFRIRHRFQTGFLSMFWQSGMCLFSLNGHKVFTLVRQHISFFVFGSVRWLSIYKFICVLLENIFIACNFFYKFYPYISVFMDFFLVSE